MDRDASGLIIAEIREVKKSLAEEIDKNHEEFKRIMFGSKNGDVGGFARKLLDLETVVCGVEGIEENRGLAGMVAKHDIAINGDTKTKTEGLKDAVRDMKGSVNTIKKKQTIWNTSLATTVMTIIIIKIKSFWGG